jgi:serine/threonine protein kinase
LPPFWIRRFTTYSLLLCLIVDLTLAAGSQCPASDNRSLFTEQALAEVPIANQNLETGKASVLGARLVLPASAVRMSSLHAQASIGRYRILEKIGAGGMADLYKAVSLDDPQGKPVALKIGATKQDSRADYWPMLTHEAKVLTQMMKNRRQTHRRSFPTILFTGVYEDRPYLVMDFIDGARLDYVAGLTRQRMSAQEADQVIRGTRQLVMASALDLSLTLRIFMAILESLQIVHALRIIHADINPTNILLTMESSGALAVLIDFGLANNHAAARLGFGTVPYMAPEKFQRRPLTIATDLYAAGALLWELVTGISLPLGAPDHPASPSPSYAVIQASLSSGLTIPHELAAIIAKATHAKPSSRFKSAQEMRAAIYYVLENRAA